MKLKNKKTGKVQTCDFAVISDDYQPFARLKDDEEYTIAALCGEEDEDEA